MGKYDYTRHPESNKLKPCHASEHVPEWRKREEAQEPDFSGIIKGRVPGVTKSHAAAGRKRPDSKCKTSAPIDSSPFQSNSNTDISTEEEIQIIMTDKDSIMS